MLEFNYKRDMFPFRSKWMDIQGSRVHYIDEGRGPVLLFCHPSIATSWMYRHLIGALSGSFRCIALDFPGFGMSTAASNYAPSIHSQSMVVAALVERLDVWNVIPVVQEIGGHAALAALLQSPERIQAMILTDTLIFPVSEYPRIQKMLGLIQAAPFRFLNARFNLMVRMTYRFGIRKRRLSRAERKEVRQMFATRERRRLVLHMLHQLREEEDLMRRIKEGFETVLRHVPTLLIYGDRDPIHEMGISKRIHALLPQSTLHLIPGEGHFPHEGAPEEMVEVIAGWWQGLTPRQG